MTFRGEIDPDAPESHQALAQALRDGAKEKGLGVREVARASNVSPSQTSRVLSARRRPAPSTYNALATAIGGKAGPRRWNRLYVETLIATFFCVVTGLISWLHPVDEERQPDDRVPGEVVCGTDYSCGAPAVRPRDGRLSPFWDVPAYRFATARKPEAVLPAGTRVTVGCAEPGTGGVLRVEVTIVEGGTSTYVDAASVFSFFGNKPLSTVRCADR